MKTELICVDIDGTLLKNDKELSEEVKNSLTSAYNMGIKIALVSGRMPSGVTLIERKLGFPCIKICNAGTFIMSGNERLDSCYLDKEVMLKIYNVYSPKYNIPLWVFKNEKWYVTGIDRYIEKKG